MLARAVRAAFPQDGVQVDTVTSLYTNPPR